jgi:hypothetical protein
VSFDDVYSRSASQAADEVINDLARSLIAIDGIAVSSQFDAVRTLDWLIVECNKRKNSLKDAGARHKPTNENFTSRQGQGERNPVGQHKRDVVFNYIVGLINNHEGPIGADDLFQQLIATLEDNDMESIQRSAFDVRLSRMARDYNVIKKIGRGVFVLVEPQAHSTAAK